MRIDRVASRAVWPPVAPVPGLRRPSRPADERSEDDEAPAGGREEPGREAPDDDEGLGRHLDLLA